MKKQLSLIVGALAVLGLSDAGAATNWGTRAGSSADLTGAPSTRTRETVNYKKYQTNTNTKTYNTQSDSSDLYYTAPANRSALYKEYTGANSSSATANKRTIRKTRSETIKTKATRKYFLAHPFYQPLKGKFGSLTDISYTNSSYDFTLNQTLPLYNSDAQEVNATGIVGSWNADQIAIKEDFSYGITDRFALMGMLRYDATDYEFTWSDGQPKDKIDDSGINMYGVGIQWRFVDNDEWIAMASGYFQHQKDTSNNILAEVKAGYKIKSSTIYGLARGWFIDLDGNTYGIGVANEYGAFYLPYQVGDSNVTYLEAGLGVFSVLNKDWTLNAEAIFGDYDWHNQISAKAAIGWQPNDWFALNLYVKTALYDNADDKALDVYWQDSSIYTPLANGEQYYLNSLTPIGTADVEDYSETSVGLQVIFEF